ncbi:MAG: hypothetical protein AAFZ63_25645 [Bacteroidota bacterium]
MIKSYRKKPVVIQALEFTGQNHKEVKSFISPGVEVKFSVESDTAWQVGEGKPLTSAIIPTLEGDMKASPGDYIIKGLNGEFYPCKPDVFEKTYDLVTD